MYLYSNVVLKDFIASCSQYTSMYVCNSAMWNVLCASYFFVQKQCNVESENCSVFMWHCCDQGFNHQRALLSQYLPLLEAILATNDVPSSSAIIKIILWVLDLDLGPCHFIHSVIFLDKQQMCNGPRTHKTPSYIYRMKQSLGLAP